MTSGRSVASAALRARIVKRTVTPLGIAEVTLLDVPLDPAAWTKKDDQQLDRLEDLVNRGD